MPITQLTPLEALTNQTAEYIQRLRLVVLRNLAAIGEACINQARSLDTYKDQTGNLRSSIGYVIVEDGQVVQESSFTLSEKGTDKVTGQQTGRAYIKELAQRFPTGISLIVAAGMNYASYVSAKGYDVIDSAELVADRLVGELFKSWSK